jgi:hypothetical protein
MKNRVFVLIVGIFLVAWTAFHFDSLMAYKSYLPETTITDMTPDERRSTGIDKLSSQERKQLQAWINKNYVKRPGSDVAGSYPTISEVLGSGTYVKLSDGSLWKIHPGDVPITQGWITPVEIIVEQSGSSDYPYTLTNSLTGSKVRAQSANQVPSNLMQQPATPAAPAPNKKKPSL